LWERRTDILRKINNFDLKGAGVNGLALMPSKAAPFASARMNPCSGLRARHLPASFKEIGMLVIVTLLGCIACVRAYQIWMRPKPQAATGAPLPSVGMHGALVEPRK